MIQKQHINCVQINLQRREQVAEIIPSEWSKNNHCFMKKMLAIILHIYLFYLIAVTGKTEKNRSTVLKKRHFLHYSLSHFWCNSSSCQIIIYKNYPNILGYKKDSVIKYTNFIPITESTLHYYIHTYTHTHIY